MIAYKYEVSISFAGEDRAFAEAVAKGLGMREFRSSTTTSMPPIFGEKT